MKVKQILYTSHFLRAFKKLPSSLKQEIVEREAIFRADAHDERLDTHKLKGRLVPYWSFSITSKHRVMFDIREDGIVAFIDVGDHSIYR